MSVVNFGPPCPVDPPTNPAPANGAIDVPITLAQLSWTNGAVLMKMNFGLVKPEAWL